MAFRQYLAMTAAEIQNCPRLPANIGWMACHFSPYGTGLSNLPFSLPKNSLLILNDRIPFFRHDPDQIATQLYQAAESLRCSGLLLDFQRAPEEDVIQLCQQLTSSLPCPVIISREFGKELDCPVFLPPCPHHVLLADHILPWKHREIWLDLAVDAEQIHLTSHGSSVSPVMTYQKSTFIHADERLHCHYQIEAEQDSATFTLWRTPEDIHMLKQEAEESGVYAVVGLYQEMQKPACHTTDRF